jgi:putative NADH-flavin reductase
MPKNGHEGFDNTNRTVSRDSKQSTVSDVKPEIIALFGASGLTGHYFRNKALDSGYHVNCIAAESNNLAHPSADWEAVKQGLEDNDQLNEVVAQANYVVIMLHDVLPGKKEYPTGFMTSFMERLYSILREVNSVKVVLFQVRSI